MGPSFETPASRAPQDEVSEQRRPLPAPLAAELRPILQALPDLAFEAALRRVVEALPSQRLGEIVLAGKRLRRVVIVFVALAVAFALHELGRRVEDVLGWQE